MAAMRTRTRSELWTGLTGIKFMYTEALVPPFESSRRVRQHEGDFSNSHFSGREEEEKDPSSGRVLGCTAEGSRANMPQVTTRAQRLRTQMLANLQLHLDLSICRQQICIDRRTIPYAVCLVQLSAAIPWRPCCIWSLPAQQSARNLEFLLAASNDSIVMPKFRRQLRDVIGAPLHIIDPILTNALAQAENITQLPPPNDLQLMLHALRERPRRGAV